jgi:hypothetical protein
MTRETTEDRETAALRSARLAYTRASRDVDACLRVFREARRKAEAEPRNRALKSALATAHERYAAAIQRMAPARARFHEAEAAERTGLSLAEIDETA